MPRISTKLCPGGTAQFRGTTLACPSWVLENWSFLLVIRSTGVCAYQIFSFHTRTIPSYRDMGRCAKCNAPSFPKCRIAMEYISHVASYCVNVVISKDAMPMSKLPVIDVSLVTSVKISSLCMITRLKDRTESVFCKCSLSRIESQKTDMAGILGLQHALYSGRSTTSLEAASHVSQVHSAVKGTRNQEAKNALDLAVI